MSLGTSWRNESIRAMLVVNQTRHSLFYLLYSWGFDNDKGLKLMLSLFKAEGLITNNRAVLLSLKCSCNVRKQVHFLPYFLK